MAVVPLITLMVGLAPASVKNPLKPEIRDQLKIGAPPSAKISPPIVRGLSSVTVRFADKSMVAKLAVLPDPSAIMPPDQLAEFVQLPPPPFIHVPSAARLDVTTPKQQLA